MPAQFGSVVESISHSKEHSTKNLWLFRTVFISILVLQYACSVAVAGSSLGSSATFLVNGEPVFPMGLYDVNRIEDMKSVAAAGFNCCWYRYGDGDDYGQYLDECAENDLYVIVSCRSENVLSSGLVSRYSTKPAVLFWDVEDDADDPAYRGFDEVKAKADAIGSADPDHARYLSLTANTDSRRAEAGKWVGITEAIGIQMYTVGRVQWDPIDQQHALRVCAQRTIYYVNEARAVNHAIIGNLQSFSWGSRAQSNGRYPTAKEIRNMSYAGLIAGLKGIVYYTYRGITGVTDHWNELKAIANDVKRLAPILTDGSHTAIETDDQDLYAAYWVYGDTLLFAAVNTSYSEQKSLSVSLPQDYTTTTPVVVDERFDMDVSIYNGQLTGDLGATESYACLINTAATFQPDLPSAAFTQPTETVVTEPADLGVVVEAIAPGGSIDNVKLYLNDTFVRQENNTPYEWGTASATADDSALLGLTAGTYTLRVVATDANGTTASDTMEITVEPAAVGIRGEALRLSPVAADHALQVFDLRGRRVVRASVPGRPRRESHALSSMVRGVFVVRTQHNAVVSTRILVLDETR